MEFEAAEGIKSQENITRSSNKRLTASKIVIILTLISTSIIVVALLLINGKGDTATTNNTPVVTPPIIAVTSTPKPIPPNWASSSAILKIENDNRNLKNEIENTDLSEPVLALPLIDTRVNFNN